MEYIIKEKDIYDVEIVMYDSIINERLIIREIPDNLKHRKAVFVNNILLDFETGEEILFLNTEDNYIVGPIYTSAMYVFDLNMMPNVTYNDLLYAANLYQSYLDKQKLIEEKK